MPHERRGCEEHIPEDQARRLTVEILDACDLIAAPAEPTDPRECIDRGVLFAWDESPDDQRCAPCAVGTLFSHHMDGHDERSCPQFVCTGSDGTCARGGSFNRRQGASHPLPLWCRVIGLRQVDGMAR